MLSMLSMLSILPTLPMLPMPPMPHLHLHLHLHLPVVTLVTLVTLLLVRFFSRRRALLRHLPVPEGASRIWGHEKIVFENEAGAMYTEWANTLGPTFKIKSPWLHPDSLVTADPLAISHIFTKNTFNYVHSPVIRPLIDRIIGRGLNWVKDQSEHRRMRAVVAPAFSLHNVRNMNDTIWAIASTLQTKLASHITNSTNSTNSAQPAVVIDLTHWASVATLDVIGRCGFNHDFQFGETDDAKDILHHWHAQVSAGMLPSAFTALVVLRTFPFITSLPIPVIQAQGAIKSTVRRLAHALIATSKFLNLEHNTDLLSLLLVAREQQEVHRRVSSEELVNHITSFALVGSETSASVLYFTLWALAKDPARQHKLRQEILQFGREPTFDEIWTATTLPYLDAVVKEGLRVFPASAHTEKVVQHDDVIPLRWPVRVPGSGSGSGGTKTTTHVLHEIPVTRGQVIHIPSRTINRLARIWGPDAAEYVPERWLDPAHPLPHPDDLTNGWSRIFAFSEGPRNCVGYRLALLEIKIFIFALIKNFVLEDTGETIISQFSSTLQPRVKGKEHLGVQLPVRISLYTP